MKKVRNTYLFACEAETSAVYFYFRASSAQQVLVKYPTLTLVVDEWAWMTEEWKARVRRTSLFDIDDDPATHPVLNELKRAADAHNASLGERVLPPR